MRLQDQGHKVHAANILILYSKSTLPDSRLGILVTRKIDSRAVIRNRIKRRIREIFRLNRSGLLENYDILIIARRGILECSYADLEKQILTTLRKEKCLSL